MTLVQVVTDYIHNDVCWQFVMSQNKMVALSLLLLNKGVKAKPYYLINTMFNNKKNCSERKPSKLFLNSLRELAVTRPSGDSFQYFTTLVKKKLHLTLLVEWSFWSLYMWPLVDVTEEMVKKSAKSILYREPSVEVVARYDSGCVIEKGWGEAYSYNNTIQISTLLYAFKISYCFYLAV